MKAMPEENTYKDWMNRDIQPLTLQNYMGAAEQEAAESEESQRSNERRLKMLQRQGFVPEGMIRGAQNAGMSPTTAGMLGAAGAGAIVLAAYGLSKYKLTKMREEGEIP